jgi:hypothetical protein
MEKAMSTQGCSANKELLYAIHGLKSEIYLNNTEKFRFQRKNTQCVSITKISS